MRSSAISVSASKVETPDLDGDGPLWQQIRRALERPILAGTWPPGAAVPSEIELMARYGAARMTVNRALRSLAGDGLVDRRRRRGTLVAQPAPERPVFEIWDIAAEIRLGGRAYRLDLIERAEEPADAEVAELLAIDVGAPVISIVCRHLAGGTPEQLEQRWINLAAAPGAVDESFEDISPGGWLLETVPWTEAEHAILAASAPPDVAVGLGIKRGTACLVVERRTWNGKLPVTFVRLWHPGEGRRLVGRFQRAYS
jgi:GntR family histidine utilization transcriptional repressor